MSEGASEGDEFGEVPGPDYRGSARGWLEVWMCSWHTGKVDTKDLLQGKSGMFCPRMDGPPRGSLPHGLMSEAPST